MFCDKCGSHLQDGGKFCPECGADITGLTEQTNGSQNMNVQDSSYENLNPQVDTGNVNSDIQNVPAENTAGSYNNESNPNTAESYNAETNPNTAGSYTTETNPNIVGSYNTEANPNTASSYNTEVNPNAAGSFNTQANSNNMSNYNTQANSNNMSNYNAQANSNNMSNYNAQVNSNNMNGQSVQANLGNMGNSYGQSSPDNMNNNMYSMSNDMNSYRNMQNNNEFNSKPKKKFNKLALVIALVVLLLGVGAAAAIWIVKPFQSKDPVKRLMLAYLNNMKKRQVKLKTELSMRIDADNSQLREQAYYLVSNWGLSSSPEQVTGFLSDILSKYKLQYNVVADLKKSPMGVGAELNLLYNDKQLINGGCKFRPWEASVYSDALLSKPIYINLEKQIQKGIGQSIDFSKVDLLPYLDILLKEDEFIKDLPKSEYVKFLSKKLGVGTNNSNLKYYPNEKVSFNGKTINADKISLNISMKEYLELSEGMVDIMAEDSKFQKSLIKKIEAIFDKMLETGDYEIFGLDKTQFSGIVSLAKSNLTEENYAMALRQLKSSLEEINSSNEYLDEMAKAGLNKSFTIDYYLQGNDVKKAEISFDLNGVTLFFDMEMLDFQSSDLDIPSVEDSYDMEDIENGDTMAIGMDVFSHLMALASVQDSGFADMIADIKNSADRYLEASDLERIENSITSMFENMQYLTNGF